MDGSTPGIRWLGENATCLKTNAGERHFSSARKKRSLHLCEVVFDVLVERQLADLLQREVLVWPDFRQVEDTVSEFLGLLRRHGLLGS